MPQTPQLGSITGLRNKAAPTGGLQPDIYGLTTRFEVSIDGGRDLGGWSSCSGLQVTFTHDALEVGGFYEHPLIFPGKMAYNDVTLERAISRKDSDTVRNWLMEVRDKWVKGTGDSPWAGDTITIRLFGSDGGGAVANWTLQNAVPTTWTGPTLNANSDGVATEKLVLRHYGFLS